MSMRFYSNNVTGARSLTAGSAYSPRQIKKERESRIKRRGKTWAYLKELHCREEKSNEKENIDKYEWISNFNETLED